MAGPLGFKLLWAPGPGAPHRFGDRGGQKWGKIAPPGGGKKFVCPPLLGGGAYNVLPLSSLVMSCPPPFFGGEQNMNMSLAIVANIE